MPGGDPLKRYKRHTSNARRELRRAVERAGRLGDQRIELLPGHKAEAARRAREVRDAADELIRTLESK